MIFFFINWFEKTTVCLRCFRPKNAKSAMPHIVQQSSNIDEFRRCRALSKTTCSIENCSSAVRPTVNDKPAEFFDSRHTFGYDIASSRILIGVALFVKPRFLPRYSMIYRGIEIIIIHRCIVSKIRLCTFRS